MFNRVEAQEILASKTRKKQSQSLWEQARSLFGILLLAFFIRTFFYGLYQVPTPSMETTMLVGERFLADKLTVCFRDAQRGEIVTLNDPTFKYSKNKISNIWERYVGISLGLKGFDWGPSNWTKRVIGAPGDEIKGVLEDGRPVIYLRKKGEADFVKLDEVYLNKYPIFATFNPGRPHPFTYRSLDRSKPLNEQVFYKFSKLELEQGRSMARDFYHDRDVKNPATPSWSSTFDRAEQPWLTGSFQDGRICLDEFHIQLKDDEFWLMGDNRLGSYDSRAWGPVKRELIHGRIIFRIWSMDSDWSWAIFELLLHPINFWKNIRWSRCFQTLK